VLRWLVFVIAMLNGFGWQTCFAQKTNSLADFISPTHFFSYSEEIGEEYRFPSYTFEWGNKPQRTEIANGEWFRKLKKIVEGGKFFEMLDSKTQANIGKCVQTSRGLVLIPYDTTKYTWVFVQTDPVDRFRRSEPGDFMERIHPIS
jgi:hypothetical protein